MSEVQQGKSRAKYGIYTLLSLVGLVALLMFAPEWCWLAFPFLLTYMVLAFDAM
jgi:hypothetical protein